MEITSSEIEVVTRARGGDASAYAVLVQDHQDAAFRSAYLILRDSQAAEDVVQDSFIRAFRSLDRFREQSSFRPWLLRIVTNLALNQVRSQRRRLSLLERIGGQARQDEPPAEALVVHGEEAQTMWQAINQLRQEDRLVLYLRYFLELSEHDMAQVIDKAPGTVKSRLSRAGRRLREVIERDYPQLRLAND